MGKAWITQRSRLYPIIPGVALARAHRVGETYLTGEQLLGNLPKVLRAVGLPNPWQSPSNFRAIPTFRLFSVHVRAQDSVDSGLVTAGLFKPLE